MLQMNLFEGQKSIDRIPWIVPVKKLVVNENSGQWCKLPYPNHPKGCPNYGKAAKCPPQAPWVHHYFNIKRPMYLVHSEFYLSEHVAEMKRKHPKWSDLQARCVLYWQSRSRKQMKKRVAEAVKILRANRITACPEAMGVNVFATALKSGLKLDKTRSIKICRHISLIGYAA